VRIKKKLRKKRKPSWKNKGHLQRALKIHLRNSLVKEAIKIVQVLIISTMISK
jgi:hypothetical protein